MHHRNIYKKDAGKFTDLARNYPKMKEFLKVKLSGQVTYQFKNPEAVSALSQALLHKDFGLDVELPPERLVPTLTLRLNYLLWIEDLLQELCPGEADNILGIDVGTGASCVFALLAAKKGWKMVATELSKTSLEIARRNIERNNMSHLITLLSVNDKAMCFKGVINENAIYHFSMCNPPFFHTSSVPQMRTDRRPPPKNGPTGSKEELFTDGGEVEFVGKMIEESRLLGDKIKIYTTMLGYRRNIKKCEQKLDSANVKSRVTRALQQGRTTRWVLAWSYCFELPGQKIKKPELPVNITLPQGTTSDQAGIRIEELLKKLKVFYEPRPSNKWYVKAYKQTWVKTSHLKRDRKPGPSFELNPRMELLQPEPEDGPAAKKIRNDDELVNSNCRLGQDIEGGTNATNCPNVSQDYIPNTDGEVLLEFEINFIEVSASLVLSLTLISGSCGKRGIFQVIQTLANQFPVPDCKPFWGRNGVLEQKNKNKR